MSEVLFDDPNPEANDPLHSDVDWQLHLFDKQQSGWLMDHGIFPEQTGEPITAKDQPAVSYPRS